MPRRPLKAVEPVPENLQNPQRNPVIAETQKKQGTLSFFAYQAFGIDKNAPPFQGQSTWRCADALRLPCYPDKKRWNEPIQWVRLYTARSKARASEPRDFLRDFSEISG